MGKRSWAKGRQPKEERESYYSPGSEDQDRGDWANAREKGRGKRKRESEIHQ